MKKQTVFITLTLMLAVLHGCLPDTIKPSIANGLITINASHADSTNYTITQGVLNRNENNSGYYTTAFSPNNCDIVINGQLLNGYNTFPGNGLSVNVLFMNKNVPDSSSNNNTGTIQLTGHSLIFNLQLTSATNPNAIYPLTGTVKY